jgi:hypothetical protein
LPARNPIAIAASAPDQRTIRRESRSGCLSYTCKQIHRPYSLGLIGLTIAITLWGFGYRLSSYEFNQASAVRAAAAKPCIDPRNSALVADFRLNAAIQPIAASPAAAAALPQIPTPRRVVAQPLPERAPRPLLLRSSLPLRSPPPQIFLQA